MATCYLQSTWQGALDLKYLSDRFKKGKAAVADFQEERHQFLPVKSLVYAHGHIVEKQAKLGPSTCLANRCKLGRNLFGLQKPSGSPSSCWTAACGQTASGQRGN